jgi:ketosteroid isomerase-like protein
MSRIGFTLIALSILGSPATGHPQNAPKTPEEAAVEKEVLQFRGAVAEAVSAKDLAKLRAIYAESFTHTHASGKMDGKDSRIVSMLAADPAIENAPIEELSVRVFGATTAIVTGKSPILNKQEGRNYGFRWIAVYVKSGGAWHLATSQATPLPVAPK